MKNYLPLLLLSWMTIGLIGCDHSVDHLQKQVDAICSKWVPDQREGICEIHLKMISHSEVTVTGETIIPEAKAEIIQVLTTAGYKVNDEIIELPDETVKKQWAIVDLSVANMRSQPSHAAEMVSQAILGTPVKVLKQKGGWSLIQTPDHYIAWTNNSSLTYCTLSEMEAWRQADRIIFLGNTSVVKTADGEVLADVIAGSILRKTGERDKQVAVQLPNGNEGYVAKADVTDFNSWKSTVKPQADALVKAGKELMSIPYLWGGTSVKALDCSGFVKTIYFQNGVILARDASLQIRYGEKIDISDGYGLLQRGDLLFFGTKEPYRVTHVGMYIGDSEYIHEAGRVKINSLDSARTNYNHYRETTLLGARRYIGLPSQRGIRAVSDHSWY